MIGWMDKTWHLCFIGYSFCRIIKMLVLGGMGRWRNDVWLWQITWRREGFEWEKELIQQLLHLFDTFRIHKVIADSWLWKASPCGSYTSKSTYLLLSGWSIFRLWMIFFPWLWQLKIPYKVSFLLWNLLRNRLPTKDNLHKRNIIP